MAKRGLSRTWVPNQHGAWAMLVTPWLMGALLAGWSWIQIPVLVTALAAYLTLWATNRWLTSRFAARYRQPVLVYGVVMLVWAMGILLASPSVLVFALVIAPATGIQLVYAWFRAERSLVNGLIAVIQACLLAPVTAVASGVPLPDTIPVYLVSLLYFAGTVLHVKSLIREAGEPAYERASVIYHAFAMVAAAFISGWLVIPFAVFLARAIVLQRRRLSVPAIGALEVGNCVLLVVTCVLAGVC